MAIKNEIDLLPTEVNKFIKQIPIIIKLLWFMVGLGFTVGVFLTTLDGRVRGLEEFHKARLVKDAREQEQRETAISQNAKIDERLQLLIRTVDELRSDVKELRNGKSSN